MRTFREFLSIIIGGFLILLFLGAFLMMVTAGRGFFWYEVLRAILG